MWKAGTQAESNPCRTQEYIEYWNSTERDVAGGKPGTRESS